MSHPSQKPKSGTLAKVLVRLREDKRPPLVAASAAGGATEALWSKVRERFPGTKVTRGYPSISPAELDRLVGEFNKKKPGGMKAPNLNTFHSIWVPNGTKAKDVRDFVASQREAVESAEVQEAPVGVLVNPWDDPLFSGQGYVRGRQKNKRGIYANWAWAFAGGDGSNVSVTVIDDGFDLTHEDFVGGGITRAHGIDGGSGVEHGTNCLGELLAQDNTKGIVGIACKARGRVCTIWTSATAWDVGDAIFKAAFAGSHGDVVSISMGSPASLPLEIFYTDAFWAITLSSWILGRIICVAAGNASTDLDTATNSAGKFTMRRGHADFLDSGAIIVGAGSPTRPHDRLSFSNFGSRVDCFAWGEKVCTTSSTNPKKYRPDFNGTSAATPIVAGAAALTQSLAKTKCKRTMTPLEMRATLSNPKTSIRSRNPGTDRIGRMPNMNLIFRKFIEPKCTIKGVYGSPGRPLLFLDPGHGGHEAAGRSTAYGGRGPHGTLEKDITLALAQRVQARFGGAAGMSRDGDYNVSVRDRLESARRFGAPAFVSLHAHSGARSSGPEIWVYGDGEGGPDPFGVGLAESIRDELAAVDRRPVRIREGRIGVLHPQYHGEDTAAVMVEAGSLADPEDERELASGEGLDRLGSAIARGVEKYIGAAAAADDDESDPEDTDAPGARAHGYDQAYDHDDAVEEDERFGGRGGGSNGIAHHHESYR